MATALVGLALPTAITVAEEAPFPKKIFTQPGSPPEGFTIGKGTTAYQGGLDGSIFKSDLRTGKGELLVDVVEPWEITTCRLLGMRVDPRTNYLFAAGCYWGNAFVYDADNGALIAEYQLDSSGASVINDLAITNNAVYFTDFGQAFLYRLPLSSNGGLPAADAATAIPLIGDFGVGVANGIVATPDGKTLIVNDSFRAKIFRVDPKTGVAKEIVIEPALEGFLDGMILQGKTLYIVTPYDFEGTDLVDRIQVLQLSDDLLSAKRVNRITDVDFDGIASGAIFGDSLYVNSSRYRDFPEATTQYWFSKVTIRPKK
jgi:sugar lactone lactonase YvrE